MIRIVRSTRKPTLSQLFVGCGSGDVFTVVVGIFMRIRFCRLHGTGTLNDCHLAASLERFYLKERRLRTLRQVPPAYKLQLQIAQKHTHTHTNMVAKIHALEIIFPLTAEPVQEVTVPLRIRLAGPFARNATASSVFV